MKLICDCCYNWTELEEADLGFCEVECPTCGITNSCPETLKELDERNKEVIEEKAERAESGTVRIMATQETGEECCLRNGIPADDDDLVDTLLEGYRQRYPEWNLFTEQEQINMYDYDY